MLLLGLQLLLLLRLLLLLLRLRPLLLRLRLLLLLMLQSLLLLLLVLLLLLLQLLQMQASLGRPGTPASAGAARPRSAVFLLSLTSTHGQRPRSTAASLLMHHEVRAC